MSKSKDESVQESSGISTTQAVINRLVKRGKQLVKGRFRYHEVPGGTTVVDCSKHPELGDFKMSMTDGQIYEIPLWVAQYLNGIDEWAGAVHGNGNAETHSCATPKHGFRFQDRPPECVQVGSQILPIVSVVGWDQRMSFEPLDFSIMAG